MTQNYEIVRGRHGGFDTGSVLPSFVFEEAGGVNVEARARIVPDMLSRGLIVPTNKPVNREIAPPKPLGKTNPNAGKAELQTAIDQLNKDKAALSAVYDATQKQLEASQSAHEAIKTEIAKYVESAAHWQRVAEEKDKTIADLKEEIAVLKNDLESATAP